MLTGLKFDLFIGTFFLWRGVTCARFRETVKVNVCIDIFIKPSKGTGEQVYPVLLYYMTTYPPGSLLNLHFVN